MMRESLIGLIGSRRANGFQCMQHALIARIFASIITEWNKYFCMGFQVVSRLMSDSFGSHEASQEVTESVHILKNIAYQIRLCSMLAAVRAQRHDAKRHTKSSRRSKRVSARVFSILNRMRVHGP